MNVEQAWKFLPLLFPLAGSVIQVWSTLQKRSNWIRRAEHSVTPIGGPFFLLDRVPLYLSYLLLVLMFACSILGLVGGGLIITASPELPALLKPFVGYSKQIFNYSIWLAIAYACLAVLIQVNAFPRLLVRGSHVLRPFWHEMTFHPGWVDAYWHATQEDEAVPINTIRSACTSVANEVVKAWGNSGQAAYQEHRATKPVGLSSEELANFLLVSNAIESAIHHLPSSPRVQFGRLYDELGKAGAIMFAPKTLRECNQSSQSLYAKLRENVPGLPLDPLIDTTVTELVRHLALKYWGRAYVMGEGYLGGFDASRLERRLRQTPGFAETQAMRAQVIKLGVEMDIWHGMDPGPFRYPIAKRLARFLLNLDCLRTRPDVKSIPISDEFIRLSAWTMDRIVDAVDHLLQTSKEPKLAEFCQAAFAAGPRTVPRWKLCSEVDYFLWFQTRNTVTDGGIFGASATTPWKIEGDSFTKS
jgi:hypothetical protein